MLWRPYRHPIPSEPKQADILLQEAITEQNLIGWNNFFKGWISSKWSQSQDAYYAQRQQDYTNEDRRWNNGTVWSKILVQQLHIISQETWTFRNKDIYGHSKQEEQENDKIIIKDKVRHEYDKRFSYSTRIQWRYFTRRLTDRLNDTKQHLKAWYENLHQAISSSEARELN